MHKMEYVFLLFLVLFICFFVITRNIIIEHELHRLGIRSSYQFYINLFSIPIVHDFLRVNLKLP